MASFRPLEACIGGLFIGVACGTYMLLAGRIAGNSGALKSIILGPREPTKLAFAGGLIIGGVLIKRLLPTAFEVSPAPTLLLAIAGLATGVGTAMSNGCTSGHGLCGLSRFSLRSLAAVPTFMAVAIAVSTANSGGVVGKMLPIAATPPATLSLAAWLAVGLAAALPPCALLPAKSVLKETYAGLWCGACFAFGLGLGGMVRPSVVTNALAPASFDATLWVLFMTALATTFVAYRVAARAGVGAASTWGAATPAKVDAPLLIGSALFGVGCEELPPPHISPYLPISPHISSSASGAKSCHLLPLPPARCQRLPPPSRRSHSHPHPFPLHLSSLSSHPFPLHTPSLFTPLPSPHPFPLHTPSLFTPLPSSHLFPLHTPSLFTPLPSSHPFPLHTSSLFTPLPSSHPFPPRRWGLSGLCPGPLIVGLAADPAAPGPLLVLATVSLGIAPDCFHGLPLTPLVLATVSLGIAPDCFHGLPLTPLVLATVSLGIAPLAHTRASPCSQVSLGMLFARPLGRATSLIPSDAAAELSDVDEVKAAMCAPPAKPPAAATAAATPPAKPPAATAAATPPAKPPSPPRLRCGTAT